MNVGVKKQLLTVIIAIICLSSQQEVRFDNFQSRRPIKYFFHLLQMKSDYNPLLYPLIANPNTCSSKVGPFCSITGHDPLKTHDIRQLTQQMSNVKAQLVANIKYGHQTYKSVERSQNQMFLIRNGLAAAYDTYLKKSMGEMNKQEMLDDSKFIDLLAK